MWPRYAEFLIAIWLVISHFLFSAQTFLDLLAAGWIGLCSLKGLHLLHIVPIALLFFMGYSYPTSELPAAYQNFILSALTLLIFAILPNQVNKTPRSKEQ